MEREGSSLLDDQQPEEPLAGPDEERKAHELTLTKKKSERARSVDADLEEKKYCAICMTIMVEPALLKCGHHFCIFCIRSTCAHTTNQCPMCRAPIEVKLDASVIDKHLQKQLCKAYLTEFN